MKQNAQQRKYGDIHTFHLPRYAEITDVGLYLEQVTRFVNTYLAQAGCAEITPSMVSNYVKQKIIPGPTKKSYSSESIACLVFVSFVKNVMSMEDIRLLIETQRTSCAAEHAYNYFCAELENVLAVVFGYKAELEEIGTVHSEEKSILRSAILATAYQIHLESRLLGLRKRKDTGDAL